MQYLIGGNFAEATSALLFSAGEHAIAVAIARAVGAVVALVVARHHVAPIQLGLQRGVRLARLGVQASGIQRAASRRQRRALAIQRWMGGLGA